MITEGGGRHRTSDRRRRRRRPSVAVIVSVVLLLGVAGFVFVRVLQHSGDSAAANDPPVSSTPQVTATEAVAPTSSPSLSSSSVSSAPSVLSASSTKPPSSSVTRSAPHIPLSQTVHTPEGMWWGVDSTLPISADTIANVRGWYRGAPRPQFWGRYLFGSYGVSRAELAYARQQKIYVFLIVADHNCSGCGGDVCGNDRTTGQARADAENAIRNARRLHLPKYTTLWKDIEQVGSCRGEPTSDYLLGWYTTMRDTGFRTGFYGNVHEQSFDFPVAYCRALKRDPTLGTKAVLDMNEDEPRIGAPRGTTGPGNAPRFNPKSPKCAPKSATKIWQYGESLTSANLTDIDQARPDTPGLLAPDGSVTG